MAITEQQVFNVADEMKAEGENVTNSPIRKRIEGGSSVASREADEAFQFERQELQDAEQQLREEARERITMIGILELELEITEKANRKLRGEAAADATRRDSLHASIERLSGLLEASQKNLADLRQRHQAQARDLAAVREKLAEATARIIEFESTRTKSDPEPEAD